MIYIVLGGGLTDAGDLPNWVSCRVRYAVKHATINDTLIFSSRYTLNIPPKIDSHGYPICEAKKMLEKYQESGGVSKKLFLETASTDTIGSAVFLRLLYSSILENQNINIITSDFHARRAKKIFEKVFSLKPKLKSIYISYKSCPSSISSASRAQHEYDSAIRFENQYGKVERLDFFLQKFLSEHTNYNKEYSSSNKYKDGMLY